MQNESERSIAKAVSEGRFREALTLLQELRPAPALNPKAELVVLMAELLERTGRTEEAKRIVGHVIRSRSLDAVLRSRCLVIEGRIAKRLGHLQEARTAFQRACSQAEAGLDLDQLCWAQLRLMTVVDESSAHPSAGSPVADLRRNVSSAGSPAISRPNSMQSGETLNGLATTPRWRSPCWPSTQMSGCAASLISSRLV